MGDYPQDRRPEQRLSDTARRATETIVAPSTAPGRAAIAVIRLSGAAACAAAERLAGPLPAPRRAALRTLRDRRGEPIDEALVIRFPAPGSYTGEDLVELQVHGSPVVVDRVLAAALEAGARLARPGEFSERAFLNGRLDLAQAEAVADLIAAHSEAAARAALRALAGELSGAISALGERLLALRAEVEAAIDFADEDEVGEPDRERLRSVLEEVRSELGRLAGRAQQGTLLGEGVRAVLCGAPNVGKSSLLNALCGEQRAIVTATAGTTRDVLREAIDLDGLPLHLSDTAGLRAPRDPIEREGVRRARAELERADLILEVVEDAAPQGGAPDELPAGVRRIVVRNKVDLSGGPPGVRPDERGAPCVATSALTGAGLEALRSAIARSAGYRPGDATVVLARRRHLEALRRAAEALAAAAASLDSPELFAEDLRCAQRALGEITGEVSSEELLEQIFATFCIGK